MTTRYFTWTMFTPPSPVLLRRVGVVDELFGLGVWTPTGLIGEWLVGDRNDVDEVTEAEARKLAPAAAFS